MRSLEYCIEHADELAQEVVNAWAVNADAGHAADLTADFKALLELACQYHTAKRTADNRRDTFGVVRQRMDGPVPEFDAALEEVSSQERAARDVFAKAFQEYEG